MFLFGARRCALIIYGRGPWARTNQIDDIKYIYRMYVSGAPTGHDQNKKCNILTRRLIGMERIHA
eukprot:SAG11_NODE_19392_length_467_cov_4.141304_1_plen_64_part_01